MLLFYRRYVLLNRNTLEFAIHMAYFVTYKLVFWSTTTKLSHAMRRQQIYSSLACHVPVSSFLSRAPSLLDKNEYLLEPSILKGYDTPRVTLGIMSLS